MLKVFFWVLLVLVVLIGGFYALNAYIYHEKQGDPENRDPYGSWARVTVAQGFEFRYPDPFPGLYVSAQEWPPLVERVVNEYACTEGPITQTDGAVATAQERTINGKTYCVSMSSEGAAGSTYRTYEYSTDRGGAVYRVVFTLRYPQCLTFDDSQEIQQCQNDQALDVDALVDQMISSIE